jgi:hypothetical protein
MEAGCSMKSHPLVLSDGCIVSRSLSPKVSIAIIEISKASSNSTSLATISILFF